MVEKAAEDTCTGCGACADSCPVQAIRIVDGKAVIGEDCIECGAGMIRG